MSGKTKEHEFTIEPEYFPGNPIRSHKILIKILKCYEDEAVEKKMIEPNYQKEKEENKEIQSAIEFLEARGYKVIKN